MTRKQTPAKSGRPAIPEGRRCVAKSVSFSPEHLEHVNRRSRAADIGLSEYVQALIRLDIQHDVLGKALTVGLQGGER